jgi:hypothetical protein
LTDGGILRKFSTANLTNPAIANGATSIDVSFVPIKQFENNIGYASGVGLNIRYNLLEATHGDQSILKNSIFWNNDWGIDLPYTQHAVLQNVQVLHSLDEIPMVGIGSNAVTSDITYNNLTVSGYHWGIVMPSAGTSAVNGGYFNNQEDFIVNLPVKQNRTINFNGPITFGNTAGGDQLMISMRSSFDPLAGWTSYALYRDQVYLNFGPFAGQQVYYALQAATAIPFPMLVGDIPSQYVGLTNQQLWDQYGVALGGAIAPVTAVAVPGVRGLVGPRL